MTGRRLVGPVLLVVAIVGGLALPAFAQRVQSSIVLVREDDVITEDLYAAGNSIQVAGRIEGDLVATAFDVIRIEGVVEGDVIALSDRVEISGEVGGAVRVLARHVEIDGDVADDVFATAWTLETGATSEIGRDLVVFARNVETLGSVGRNVEGTQNRLRVGGTVGGDVEVTASEVSLLPGLSVTGDVVYTSGDEATVAETASVDGSIIGRRALAPNVRVRSLRLLAGLIAVVAALLLGIGVLWSSPDRSLAARNALERRPLAAIGWGVGVASVPLALTIVLGGLVSLTSLSSSGPLVLLLVPVALALASLVGLGLLAAPVPVSLLIGGRLRPGWSSYGAFVAGFFVLVVVWLLPWIGGILTTALAIAGLGAWLVATETR